MPTAAISNQISNINPGEVFQSTVDYLPNLGYVIWKTRPMAWLVIANRERPEGKVNATLSFRPGDVVVLSISLASETMTEVALQAEADELSQALQKHLSGQS